MKWVGSKHVWGDNLETVLTLFFIQILYYDIHLQGLFFLFPMILMKPLNENSIHISKCQRVNLTSPIREWVASCSPSPRDLPNSEIEPRYPTSKADSLPAEPPEKP